MRDLIPITTSGSSATTPTTRARAFLLFVVFEARLKGLIGPAAQAGPPFF